MKHFAYCERIALSVLFLFSVLATNSGAQALQPAGSFTSSGGQVQFLPGGIVLKTEESSTALYSCQGASFRPFHGRLSQEILSWTSFDWEGVDYLDQLDVKSFDPDLRAFLPSSARVKKVLSIPLSPGRGTLVLICSTHMSSAKFVPPDATDIFITAVIDRELEQHKAPKFEKLWEKLVVENSSYGQFMFEILPGNRALVLLYSAVPGGGSVDRTLNVFRLVEE